nr:lmo0937 family membrane protein [candidate division Zixibacteria bacterium]
MLWTIAMIMLILWALGLLTGYTLGGLVHVLIVIAIIAVIFRLISGRRAI